MTLIACLSLLVLAQYTAAMEGADHSGHGASKEAAEHATMEHGSMTKGDTFIHAEMVDGIHAEFQVMDLASMNMKDPEGKTHHVMASFLKNDEKIEKSAGKIKVIAPSGKEQVATLQHFGSGIFAANFTFDEPGKWGIICLFKDQETKHTVKFWYPHHEM